MTTRSRFLALAAATVAAATMLSACAPSEPDAPSAATASAAPSQSAEAVTTPTPEPTPERVEFSGASIAFADLLEVVQHGDEAVILLPRILDATVTIEGFAVEKWVVDAAYASGLGGVDVNEFSPGTLTIKPLAGYDALADQKDFVKSADGAITFSVAEGTFTVQVEGVDQ